ncbi:hypothetical protein V1264_007826 [Littorina saxatilis]
MSCLWRIKRICRHCLRRWRHIRALATTPNSANSTVKNSHNGFITAKPPVRLPRRWLRAFLSLLLMTLVVLVLHYRVLPSSMGYYNQDCSMKEERRERMRHVLRHVVRYLNEENATYWLDFGTLLGVVREGDIMVHDGDMDLSRLANDLDKDRKMMERVGNKLQTVGITGNAMVVKYQDVQVDMFRWQTFNASSGETLLRKYYPFVPKVGFAERLSDYLFPTEIQPSVLFPLRQLSVLGVFAKIPRRTLDFLKRRYPLTWFMTFPYKWKCWTKG